LANFLDLAWEQARKVSGDRDLPDVISLEDVATEWPSFRDRLLSRITAGHYTTSHVQVVDLPKDPLNVRPIVRLALEDRLVYDACVLAMAPVIDGVIPNSVYSYRWSKYKQALYSPAGRWIRMQRRGRRFNRKHQQLLLLRTDVTSFYEYVDIDMLMSDLRRLRVDNWSISLLENFLNQFNNEAHAWGLPQGPDSSGILANLYLLPIDNYLRHGGFTHLRYSDDIMVFGPDWAELRKTLLGANHIFRSRHLSLSASKTKIVPAHRVAVEFEDTSKDAIRYNIDIASPMAQDELEAYFDKTVANDPLSVRDLRFALNQLRRVEDDYAVSWLLRNLANLPQITREAIRYLRSFHLRRAEIDMHLSRMLADKCFDLYPSVERQIINYFMFELVQERNAIDACWRIVQDQNKGIVREFAARYIGRFCGYGDGARLRELFERESNEEVRRALLIAFYESGECPKSLVTSLSLSNNRLGVAARYLQLAPQSIPCPSMEVIW
jgi:hypothetical protein